MIREKHTKSGKLLEADFYPVFSDGRRMPSRAPKSKRSTAEQARYNRRQAVKKIIRIINTNFDSEDIIMHPTYEQSKAPQSIEDARKDLVNYLRRVKRRREAELKKVLATLEALPQVDVLKEQRQKLEEKAKKLAAPFKYCYTTEKVQYKTGKYAGRDNWHFHLFLTGGLDRKTLEEMWQNGMRTNADRFQPEKFGPEAIAKYMVKDPEGSKSFCCSRNMDKPVYKKKDGVVTPYGIERMAKQRIDDREYWENRYKGYRFIKCYSRFNEFNGNWYVSVVMYKNDSDPPRWEFGDWLDE